MAENEGVGETGEAIVMCTSPDVCLTSGAPVPYQIIARFDSVIRQEATVRFKGNKVMTMDSRITNVIGDEAGTGGGIISGVNLGYCRPITHSTTVRAGGNHVIYHSALYWMNCAGPEGPGNTIGTVVYVESVNCVYVGPLGEVVGDTNPPVVPETKKEESWWDVASPWVHGVLDVVGLIPGVGEIADGANALIYLGEGNYADAALSAASMVPIAGWAASGAKWVRRADKAVDAVKAVDKAVDAAKTTEKAVDAGNSLKKASDAEKALEKATEVANKSADGAKITKGQRTFESGGRKFWLEEPGSAKSGWKHIYDGHVDRTRNLQNSKFDSRLTDEDIKDLLEETVKHGRKSKFYDQDVFEFRTNYKRTGYKSYRTTVNPDGSIQSFHPLN